MSSWLRLGTSSVKTALSVVLCADRGLDYGQVADVLDAFQRAGIAHIGLAADKGGQP